MMEKIIATLMNPYTGTVAFVVALGYVVRAVPVVANRFIPLIGIATGSAFFTIVIPLTLQPDANRAWNWYVLMWGVGVGLSAFAWLIHLMVISKLEDYLRNKIPALDAWFVKTSDEAPGTPASIDPKK